MPRIAALFAGFLALLPGHAIAHPHLFVRVDVTLIYEDERPIAVRLDWLYDDYFSLLITADLGIDLDGDLQLTPAEEERLANAVKDWPPEFTGDLEVMQGGKIVPLGEKRDHRMIYRDGIVRETHVRPLIDAADAPLTIRAYDPSYFTAYELAGPVTIEGRDGCTASVTAPDLDRAYSLVEELLYGRPASDVGPDEEFPEVGAEFADTIDVTCAG